MREDGTINTPCDFIIFGALGDLSCRKLFPALYQLEAAGLLHAETKIIACAREAFSLTDFIAYIKDKLVKHLDETIDEAVFARLSERLNYCQLDFTHAADFAKIKTIIHPERRISISYLAIPPSVYAETCQGLSTIGLTTAPARVVLEKPIGHDLPSSIEINQSVGQYFSEQQIYRMDHYLGKESVLNLLALRFANPLFSKSWDGQSIDKVEICLAETVGVEGRWSYYDKAGQLRDMLQNHILQILSLFAMERPENLSAKAIRREKLKLLSALRPISDTALHSDCVRGQYLAGQIENQPIPGYLEETGAKNNSSTETFVAIKAFIDNARWRDVPFYLMTGKRLARKQSEIVIYFKAEPNPIFKDNNKLALENKLTIPLQTNAAISLEIKTKVPGMHEGMPLQKTQMNSSLEQAVQGKRAPDAYEHLILDIMAGNQSPFVSREEVELAWQWIDQIRVGWEKALCPLYTYPAGCWEPEEALGFYRDKANAGDE